MPAKQIPYHRPVKEAAQAIKAKWVIAGASGFALFILFVLHVPWVIHQIRKPVFEGVCEVGKEGDYVLHMVGSANLTSQADADMLAAVRVASGDGSIPIHELRVRWDRQLIDLDEHPSWERLMRPMELQDSAASVVVLHNLSYCNVPEPWALWRREPKPFVAPVDLEPHPLEVAEQTG